MLFAPRRLTILRRAAAGAWLGLALGAAACRTADEAPRAASAAEAPGLTLHEVADDRPAPPRYETVRTDEVQLVSGYDLAGADSCLPLPEGRTCLDRPAAAAPSTAPGAEAKAPEATQDAAAACARAGGELRRCEDCSTLCSVPLTSPAQAPR
jgi:hypothetical protein